MLHEFSTIGVKEDVTEIILNLKDLVVSSEHDEPVTMYLRKQGPGDVTAADINPPAGVEVHNPELKLATLNDKGKPRDGARRRAWPWLRLVGAEQGWRQRDRPHAGRLDLLAGPQGDLQGRGHPCRAAHGLRQAGHRRRDQGVDPSARRPASAGKTLVELFGLARELNVEAEGIDIGPSPVDEQLAADLALPVEDLNLTVRSYNCLKREGIHTVGELISRSEQDLLDIRNFGAKSIDEVKAKLVEMGLSLKDSAPGFDPQAALAAYADDDDDSFVEDEQY